MTIVIPPAASSRITFSTSATSSGSSALVTSSSSMQLGVHRQRPDDRDALLLSAREPVRVLVALVRQTEPPEELAGMRLGLGTSTSPSTRVGARVTLREHRHVREQVEGLEHDADPSADRGSRRRPRR